jgi:hypothetical protein
VASGLAGNETVLWWAWGLWTDLPAPNIYQPFGDDVLRRTVHAMAAYEGENARNAYLDLVPARARVAAILGSERVFGYGAGPASPLPYAQLLIERRWVRGGWAMSPPRSLDPSALRP